MTPIISKYNRYTPIFVTFNLGINRDKFCDSLGEQAIELWTQNSSDRKTPSLINELTMELDGMEALGWARTTKTS